MRLRRRIEAGVQDSNFHRNTIITSEATVKKVAEKIGFNYEDAVFGAVGKLYKMKYGIHPNEVNHLPKIVFDMENPFNHP